MNWNKNSAARARCTVNGAGPIVIPSGVNTSNPIGGLARGAGRVLLAGAAFVAGCVDSNNRTVIGRGAEGVVLESFTAPEFHDPKGGPSWGDDHPSLIGLDRDHWAKREFLVPVDGTRHRPTYAMPVHYTDATPRQRREYPTLLSSLSLDGSDAEGDADDDRITEALVGPLDALWELILIPLRLIVEPQTLIQISPSESYQRRPANRDKFAAPPLHPLEESQRRPELRRSPAP